MRRSNYISLLLLLLFVGASFCHLSVGLICSCDQGEADNEHHCCSCEIHLQDCSHHDKTIHERGCQLHFYSHDDATQVVESREQRGGGQIYKLFLCSNIQGLVEITSLSLLSSLFDGYSFSSFEWTLLSCSLRAPPVLV